MQAQTRSPHFNQDSTAQTYRDIQLPRVFAPWAQVLLQIQPPRPGEVVLDVATGPGTVARQAAALVGPRGRVVGVDISAAMLSVARLWEVESEAAPLEYVEAPSTAMPLSNATFDVAYCQQGLQHMSDSLAALREIRRLLKPGGRLGVAVWKQSPFGLFREIAANMAITGDGPRPSDFGRDPADLAASVREAGFEDVQVQTRELVAVLEGGVPQALHVGAATSAGAAMARLSAEQQETLRAAFAAALEPMIHDGAVHLLSISNIATARR